MKLSRSRTPPVALRVLVAAAVALAPVLVVAKTEVKPPKNKFTPEQDVELGREAAAEARQALPIIRDSDVTVYLGRLGDRLVEASPDQLNHSVFEYSFTPVNQSDINAFALPGGPMFVNRGMVEAATTEDEVAGVMAHELAHVLLRHGTANVTKSQSGWVQLGSIAGAIAGAVVGGNTGTLINGASQFGLGTFLLKYSREYEKQADLLGVQIMAEAGYDPRSLASIFEAIQKKGDGAQQWLSSHPNPGNRTAYILAEAAGLPRADVSPDRSGFERIRQKFASMPPAPSAADTARASKGGSAPTTASMGTLGEPVPPPSSQFRTIRAGSFLEVSVPSNWNPLSSNSSLKVVPRNAYGEVRGQAVYTHGVEFGVTRAASRDLSEATNALLQNLSESNPWLQLAGQQQRVQMSGRTALATPLTNRSDATDGDERIGIYTAFLADGSLFYYATVVPADEADYYRATFQRIGRSIRLNDRR